ncbi:T9SS type A sorting domain-containing protein [bacterium]|nr:T9SS type A sorting domain-containing protein [bacterium]
MRTTYLLLLALLLPVLCSARNAPTAAILSSDPVQFVRQGTSGEPLAVTARWDDAAQSRLLGLQADEVAGGEAPLVFRTLVPSPRGVRYEVTGWVAEGEPVTLPAEFARALEYVWRGESGRLHAPPVAREGERIIFRDIAATPVEVFPFEKQDGRWVMLDEVRVELEPVPDEGVEPVTTGPAESFLPLYRRFMTDGELDELGEPAGPGGYLVLMNPAFMSNIQEWILWKKQQGHSVEILEITGSPNYQSVRNDVLTAWQQADPKPEYLLIVGDPELGASPIPGDIIESNYPGWGQVITDHSYALLEGDDPWPELWVGRWSISSIQEITVISRKTVRYEKGIGNGGDHEWMNKGLVICDNRYSSTGLTSSWVRRQLLEYGFAQVDSVWFPPTLNPEPINTVIEEGVSLVNYRGFGSPGGWSLPDYRSEDVTQLSNSGRTPVITSIVCGTGAFDHPTDPCLGEAFLRAGTPNGPTGGVAFVGPSELDTHTKWNNAIDMGIYQGLLHEGMNRMGSMVHRGKLAVWNGFPNNQDPGFSTNSAWFYLFTYNILGDPGLPIRTEQPVELVVEAPDEFAVGSTDLSVEVQDANGTSLEAVNITLYSELWEQGVTRRSDAGGMVRFDMGGFELEAEDTLFVTAHTGNALPMLHEIAVVEAPLSVGLSELTFEGDAQPGETVTLTPVLINNGTGNQGSFTATLTTLEGGVTIESDPVSYDALGGPGSLSEELEHQLTVDLNTPDGFDPGLLLNVAFDSGDETTVRLPFTVEAPHLEPVEPVITGQEVGVMYSVSLSFANNGSVDAGSGTLSLSSELPFITFQNDASPLPSIPAGGTADTEEFEIRSSFFAYPGQAYPITWTMSYDSGREETGTFEFIPQEAELTDPLTGDRFGYRAYEPADSFYFHAPRFDWLEIDPVFGGGGERLDLEDDGDEQDTSTVIELPFTFTYYGEDYDQITVCSNGWLKPGDTGEKSFRNWNLPDGPGPTHMIAPFWDDLNRRGGDVVYYYDETWDRVIVEWSRMYSQYGFNADSTLSFQAILYDPAEWETDTGDGIIEFQYKTLADTDLDENFSTTGIRNEDNTSGLQIRYATHYPEEVIEPPHDGWAYRFTTSGHPTGRALRLAEFGVIDDGSLGTVGNGNGLVDNGETVALIPRVFNNGTETADNVTITLTSADTLIDFQVNQVNLGGVEPRTMAYMTGLPFLMEVSYSAPERHTIRINVELEADGGYSRRVPYSMHVRAPLPQVGSYSVSDPPPDGNENGYVEPGETIELQVDVENIGQGLLTDMTAYLLDSDPNVTVLEDEQTLDELQPGQSGPLSGAFLFEVSDDVSFADQISLPLRFETQGVVVGRDTINILIGTIAFNETFQDSTSLSERWVTIGWPWALSDAGFTSAPYSLRWYYQPFGGYPPNTTSMIISSMFPLQGNARLTMRVQHDLAAGDTLQVRVNFPGHSSQQLGTIHGTSRGNFLAYTYDILAPEDADNAMLFLMARSDGSQQGQGIMLDDIMVFDNAFDAPEPQKTIIPKAYKLHEPYPNPFNPTGTVAFDLPQPSDVKILVYDLLGREVTELVNGRLRAGAHHVSWNAERHASGVYFIQMEAGGFHAVRKAVLLK